MTYINDLPKEVHTTVKMFAADTKLFTDISRGQMAQELQKDVHVLDKWTDKWQLTFNADRCKVMHIHGTCGKGAKRRGAK